MDNTSSNTHKLSPLAILPFLLAGRALLTVLNLNTSVRFTYRIQAPGKTAQERKSSPILFVSVLTGTDNDSHYTYIGVLVRRSGQFKLTAKSRLPSSDLRVLGFDWLCRQARLGALDNFPHVEVRHHNECGACGRTLTVPESIDSGLGPICAKAQGIEWTREDRRAA